MWSRCRRRRKGFERCGREEVEKQAVFWEGEIRVVKGGLDEG